MDENNLKSRKVKFFCLLSATILFIAAFCFDDPSRVFSGEMTIIASRDALITDYFELAGYGAGFFNAGIMLLIALLMVDVAHIPFTGLTMATIFLNVGFAFWGKNPVNIIPIIIGTWIYSKLHRQRFARYLYTALFTACLAPFVTELCYILPFSIYANATISVALGIFIGTYSGRYTHRIRLRSLRSPFKELYSCAGGGLVVHNIYNV